jgi:hypothetical protein
MERLARELLLAKPDAIIPIGPDAIDAAAGATKTTIFCSFKVSRPMLVVVLWPRRAAGDDLVNSGSVSVACEPSLWPLLPAFRGKRFFGPETKGRERPPKAVLLPSRDASRPDAPAKPR